jgi:diacylglycerol kinase family enzyme
MKFLVLLNQSAGTLAGIQQAEAQQRIADGFAAAGAQAEVRFIEMRFLEKHVHEAAQSDVDAVIAGGGDGTLNSIANALAHAGRKAFGVLPLGTFNHFAKELGVPLDLDAAVTALAHGHIEELPVGELNGQIFLSFSAIGLHPEVVHAREEHRRQTGRSKLWALLVALWRILPQPPLHLVRLSARGRTIGARTSSIIICNNEYQMKAFGLHASSIPERGLLNVYVATAPRPLHNVWLMLRAMFGTLTSETAHFHTMALPEMRVDTWRSHKLKVSIDGELLRLRPPLIYRIRQQPLRVLVPAKEAT